VKTQQVDINRVIPHARNPRNNREAVAKVAASIREFGFRQPIVVDNEMTVVAGHTRLLAAKQLSAGQHRRWPHTGPNTGLQTCRQPSKTRGWLV
jgi:ParB-like chromosome segregation protein Spo0J